MSSPLGLANHCLYQARLLLAGWALAKASEQFPSPALDLAFAPPVRDRLLEAYGWFLLAACRVTQIPPTPPRSVSELPPLPTGLVRPEEVERCIELERQGWLGALLNPISALPGVTSTEMLATSHAAPNHDEMTAWATALAELAERLNEVVDEF